MTGAKRGRPAIKPGERGSVRATKRGATWQCRVRYRDQEGRPHEFNVKGRTKHSCESAAHEHWVDLKRAIARTDAQDSASSLASIAERWFAHLDREVENQCLSPNSVIQYRRCWNGTLRPMVAHWDVNETTRADVQELLYGNLFRRNQRGEYIFDEDGSRIPLKGPQPRQVLRLLLGFAADFGHRRDGMNPLAGTRKPTASPRNPRLLRALTPEEWQELLEMARTAALRPRAAPHLYVALAIMYYTGVRIGEALGLTVDKVDLRSDPPTIVFDEKLPESFRVGQRQLLEMTKSQDQRVVVVVPQLAEILANVLARLDYTRAGDPLIVTKRGTFVTHANVRTTLRALVAGTALEWMHPHALRRTYLTAAERVYGLAGAADLGGHLDERVTQRHYVIIEGVKVLDPRAMFVEVPADADAEARRPRLRAVD